MGMEMRPGGRSEGYDAKKTALSNMIDGGKPLEAKLAALNELAEESETNPNDAMDFNDAVLERYVRFKDEELYNAYKASLSEMSEAA